MVDKPERLSVEEYEAVARRVDELIRRFEALPFPQVQAQVFELLETIDILHRAGLTRLVEFLQASGQGVLLDRAAEDPIIQNLFILYDLVQTDDRAQVEAALDMVRPYIHSHGGQVEVLDIEKGVVRVRLGGACIGCAGSAMTLRRDIETALKEGYPDFRGMLVHEPSQPPNALPLVSSQGFVSAADLDIRPWRDARRPIFQDVARLADVPPGTMRHYDVGGVPVLLANVAGEVYSVRDQCPTGVAPLSLGSFSPPIIVCAWHNEAWDIRTGKRVDGPAEPRLDVLPIAISGDMIRLALNTTSSSSPSGTL